MLLQAVAMAAESRSETRGADACCAAVAQRLDRVMSSAGSRRRRLWELPDASHCPVIGVCLPLPVLRKLSAKAMVGAPAVDDHELHSSVVHQCSARNPLTEALQRELDRRCSLQLQRFAAARNAAALAQLWRDAVERGDIAAALWAALTHPRCDAALTIRICRDVHMLQHQAGAMARADLRQLRELSQQADALERDLNGARQRCIALQTQRAGETEALGAQLMRVRAELIARDSEIAALRDEASRLREQIPGLDSRRELTRRVAALAEQQRHLLCHNAELREQLRRATVEPRAATPSLDEPAATIAPPLQLDQRAVLCVGGRGGDVARYRDCIEHCGGRFLHHDGGVEDNRRLLDSSLAAADVVICQAGCISHNAYWLVKDYCKRSGKRCVLVDRPSVSGLARSLGQALAT